MTRRHVLIGLGAVAIIVGALSAAALLRRDGPGAAPNDPGLVALGARIYAQECAACHGARLEGQPNWQQRLPNGRLPAPPHDASGHTWHHPDQQLFAITKQGLQSIVPGYVTDMPAYAGKLTDREIWAVLAYIKSTWPPEIRARQARITAERGG
ncbi:MAG: c-type cytochrome [Rhodospirillales bacterium]|nr:c-type cytochrome [Rhodospirillales bacterium]